MVDDQACITHSTESGYLEFMPSMEGKWMLKIITNKVELNLINRISINFEDCQHTAKSKSHIRLLAALPYQGCGDGNINTNYGEQCDNGKQTCCLNCIK